MPSSETFFVSPSVFSNVSFRLRVLKCDHLQIHENGNIIIELGTILNSGASVNITDLFIRYVSLFTVRSLDRRSRVSRRHFSFQPWSSNLRVERKCSQWFLFLFSSRKNSSRLATIESNLCLSIRNNFDGFLGCGITRNTRPRSLWCSWREISVVLRHHQTEVLRWTSRIRTNRGYARLRRKSEREREVIGSACLISFSIQLRNK